VGNLVNINGIVGMTELNGNSYTVLNVTGSTVTINVDSSDFTSYISGGTISLQVGVIVPGSINITDSAVTVWTDPSANGVLVGNPSGSGTIDYVTGVMTGPVPNNSGTFSYYPLLPVMGIESKDKDQFGIDDTIFFDTSFAYNFESGLFSRNGTATWTGNQTQFFWSTNYQGVDPSERLFFVTNNNISTAATPYDPIYYFDSSWHKFTPVLTTITTQTTLWQALILIPYYGRLLALNTWEGATADTYGGSAKNFFARCRFSQIGSPIATNAWYSDQFGLGGFLDAPTQEAIVSVGFYRNTLIVFFEYSTWQLRYIGEYGLPFIFERISSDFGSVSTFSSIIFDQGVFNVSDRGIMQAGAGGIKRLDDQIPETIFGFQIQNNAPNYVHGVRDFEKELVYWNYIDTPSLGLYQTFPNTVLLYNYKNNTWAQFRDTITCFGLSQFVSSITWDSLTTSWDGNASWDNVDDQNYTTYVTMGNQQGFISVYENPDANPFVSSPTNYAPSLYITNINTTVSPTLFSSPNHNLNDYEIIYLTGLLWTPIDPGYSNMIYNVIVVDQNTFYIQKWNGVSYSSVTITTDSTYIGNGYITLFPKMNIVGKDFNPFQEKGLGFKISYIDFLMSQNVFSPSIPATSVQLFVNASLAQQANMLFYNADNYHYLSNQEVVNSTLVCGYISFADITNPCIITSPGHSLTTGALIYIANVVGMTEINSPPNFNITVINANQFSLNGVDATLYTPYISGGIWNAGPIEGENYTTGSDYAWYRFYATQFGQFLRIGLTYDDFLMNQLSTHQTPFELHAMNLWMRSGGRLVN
jgi:hypothetical protein